MDAEGSRSFVRCLTWRSRQIGRNQGGVGAAADSRLGGGATTQARRRRGDAAARNRVQEKRRGLGFGIYESGLLESQGKAATGWTRTLGTAAEESGSATARGRRKPADMGAQGVNEAWRGRAVRE